MSQLKVTDAQRYGLEAYLDCVERCVNHVGLEQALVEHEQSMRDDINSLCAKMYNDISMKYSADKTARALKEKQIVVDQQAAKDIKKSIQL